MAKKKVILGAGTRFNINEQKSLKNGSRIWAVWDNEAQDFIRYKDGTRRDFYKYDDAVSLRNELELKRLAGQKV